MFSSCILVGFKTNAHNTTLNAGGGLLFINSVKKNAAKPLTRKNKDYSWQALKDHGLPEMWFVWHHFP